jgi:hypothetical protein
LHYGGFGDTILCRDELAKVIGSRVKEETGQRTDELKETEM